MKLGQDTYFSSIQNIFTVVQFKKYSKIGVSTLWICAQYFMKKTGFIISEASMSKRIHRLFCAVYYICILNNLTGYTLLCSP